MALARLIALIVVTVAVMAITSCHRAITVLPLILPAGVAMVTLLFLRAILAIHSATHQLGMDMPHWGIRPTQEMLHRQETVLLQGLFESTVNLKK